MINKIAGFKVFIFPLSAAVVVLMSVLFIKPAYDEMQLAKQTQAQKQQQLNDLQIQNQKLVELKNTLASRENDRSLTQTALPAKSDMEDYIAELYGRASRSGILLSGVNSDKESSISEPYICDPSADTGVSGAVPDPAASGSAYINASAAVSDTGDSPSQSCVNAASIELIASGTWDQIINFFKYLEDTNRIANIKTVAMANRPQSTTDQQPSGDIINVVVGLSTFYKEKSSVGTSSAINSLASGKGFEENVIKKLNEVIFAPYVAPVVSESGERNIFK